MNLLDPALLDRALPLLGPALMMTLLLGLVSFAAGCVLGMLLTLARLSGRRPLVLLSIAYVSVFRGTPLLIQILVIYFGLPQMGIQLGAFLSAVTALTLHTAAYLSENFRAGFLAVDRGQWEAADSLGMSSLRTLRRVVLPQAIRVATPAVGSRFIALMKDTSLASVITVAEITQAAEAVGSSTFRYMEMFLLAAVVYWLMNAALSIGQAVLERRMGRAYA
ncbi:amino acid ABC transporter permease [Actinomadura vinacea]|uniref:Amino acid ABC transporter permease n=1 Tax=Actinomadura vinacea TaxID=115336 RepID=A0ABP5WBJ4_9ACTN